METLKRFAVVVDVQNSRDVSNREMCVDFESHLPFRRRVIWCPPLQFSKFNQIIAQ